MLMMELMMVLLADVADYYSDDADDAADAECANDDDAADNDDYRRTPPQLVPVAASEAGKAPALRAAEGRQGGSRDPLTQSPMQSVLAALLKAA